MFSSLLSTITLLAQATGTESGGAPAGGAPGGGNQMLFVMVLMFVMMYFVLIRPQRKKQKALQAQMASLKKDDRVITIGGLHGIVANVKERTVILKLSDTVRVEFEKTAVATIVKKGDEAPETSTEPLPELKK